MQNGRPYQRGSGRLFVYTRGGFQYGRNRGGACVYLLVAFSLPKGKPNVHHLVKKALPNKANRRGKGKRADGERLNHHQKPNKRAAFFLGTETAPKEQPERVKRQGGGGRVEATHNRKQTTRRPRCNAYTRQNKRPPLRKEQPKAKNRTFENSNT